MEAGHLTHATAREFLDVSLPEQGALGVFGALHAAAVPVELHVDFRDGVYAVTAAEVVAVAFGQTSPLALGDVAEILPQVRDLPNVRRLALSVLTRVEQENCAVPVDAVWRAGIADLKLRLEAAA